jgi:hypothetical protein
MARRSSRAFTGKLDSQAIVEPSSTRPGRPDKERIMKLSIIAGALCLGFASAGAALANTTITEPTVTIGSMQPSPESPVIARKEAAAALAQAKQDCRKESGRDAQKSCLGDAREDYNHMMARAGRRDASKMS